LPEAYTDVQHKIMYEILGPHWCCWKFKSSGMLCRVDLQKFWRIV